MPRFLIDANLPYRFSLWRGDDCEHVFDHDDTWSDMEIWRYAQQHDLVIVTKNADFSDWIMLSNPPPKVVHVRVGNMKMRDFHGFIRSVWPDIRLLVESYKLLIVYADRIDCVA